MFDNQSTSISLEYLNGMVKANEPALAEIDKLLAKDPKAREQFRRDVQALETVKTQTADMLALLFDQTQAGIRDEGKYKYIDPAIQRPIPYRYLRQAGRTEYPNVIKNLRRLQLTEFAQPVSRKKYGKEQGFSLRWKNSHYEPTKQEKEDLERWEQRLADGFFFAAGETVPNLSRFLGEAYSDYFELDDITIGIIRDGMFDPIGFQLQDPALWVPIMPRIRGIQRYDADELSAAALDEKDMLNKIAVEIPDKDYMLMRNMKREAAVTRDMLFKSHFFVRSEYKTWKRGYSPLEQAVTTLAGLLNAMSYNFSNFSNNRTPQGIMAMMGGVTNTLTLEKMKKILWAQMSGASSQHKIPIVGLPEKGDLKWVPVHSTAKEMEFYTGMTLWISVLFALSGTDPNEAGLANFKDTMRANTLQKQDETGVYQKSRDTGLITFLSHMEATLNTPMKNGRNVFEDVTKLAVVADFRGLAEENLKAKVDIGKSRMAVDRSVNEIREENGEEAAEYLIEGAEGEKPVNVYDIVAIDSTGVGQIIRQDIQTKVQAKQQEEAMKQQQAMAAQQQPGPPEPGGGGELSEKDKQLIAKYGEPTE